VVGGGSERELLVVGAIRVEDTVVELEELAELVKELELVVVTIVEMWLEVEVDNEEEEEMVLELVVELVVVVDKLGSETANITWLLLRVTL
jgi:hypothetical protein